MLMAFALLAHLLGVVIWIGGMFFAYTSLRPAAVNTLQPPHRLPLWSATFKRFFPWVWLSIIAILFSGYSMIHLLGGFKNLPLFIHIMHGLGLLMIVIFMHVFFSPFKRLKKAVMAQVWADGGKALAQIRVLIAINLSLGIITIFVATLGKYFL